MISLGRTDREQISLTHAAVNAPTPAPASNNRKLSRRCELVDAMSLAVGGGVKNCPSWLRRSRSSTPLWSRLASSAIASGSGLSAASFKGTVDAERRPCRPFRGFGYILCGKSGFTGILRYPKSCLRFNVMSRIDSTTDGVERIVSRCHQRMLRNAITSLPEKFDLSTGSGRPPGRAFTFDVSHLTWMFPGITTLKFCEARTVARIKV